MILQGRALIPGQAQGRALVTSEPLSFWGGYDYQIGEIIEMPIVANFLEGLSVLQ